MNDVQNELLRHAEQTAPDAARREALKSAILDRIEAPPARARFARPLLLAAAILLGLGWGGQRWWRAPTEAIALGETESWIEVQAHVQAQPQGVGVARSDRILWEEGTLRVEVEPERGVELIVETEEARVRVVGTLFEVHREDFGTEVRVDRGAVEVTCHERVHLLGAQDTTRCFPSAEVAVGYVLELQRRSMPAVTWLEVIEEARRSPQLHPETTGGLLALEIDAYLLLERNEHALRLLRDALEEGTDVPDRAISAVAGALTRSGDCARATPLLQRLAEGEDPHAEAWLEHCRDR